MTAHLDRQAAAARFRAIDDAFRAGNLVALRAAVDDPEAIPNGPMPMPIGPCLEYAIYHSPIAFIRQLLEIGADVRPDTHAGFPPLLAALSCSRSRPGSVGREDTTDVLNLLIEFGADPDQRGLNDYTALHMAVAERNLPAVHRLLDAGANPQMKTRIDDCDTPLEMAERAGLSEIAAVFKERTATPRP